MNTAFAFTLGLLAAGCTFGAGAGAAISDASDPASRPSDHHAFPDNGISLAAEEACSTDSDCSLNGDCDTATGVCACDAAWTGSRCSTLALEPLDPERVIEGAYRPGARTSWGANVLRSEEDGLYHMFVAEMKGNCTLTSWIPNSQVVHAVAETVDGPFKFREVLFDTFHHNPRLTRANDGTYLLFMIGQDHGTSWAAARDGASLAFVSFFVSLHSCD